jgi:hypothetical protein
MQFRTKPELQSKIAAMEGEVGCNLQRILAKQMAGNTANV